ncbi:hypothetical protein C8J57DRAFT_1466317 [Mycena rebaudengoi]|nr:hypothetical protein C8J57DRAFT_1466317 [Mycena rebaudengoi]
MIIVKRQRIGEWEVISNSAIHHVRQLELAHLFYKHLLPLAQVTIARTAQHWLQGADEMDAGLYGLWPPTGTVAIITVSRRVPPPAPDPAPAPRSRAHSFLSLPNTRRPNVFGLKKPPTALPAFGQEKIARHAIIPIILAERE